MDSHANSTKKSKNKNTQTKTEGIAMTSLMDALRETHINLTHTSPHHTYSAYAPGTWVSIGEHNTAIGGIIVLGTIHDGAAVAISSSRSGHIAIRYVHPETQELLSEEFFTSTDLQPTDRYDEPARLATILLFLVHNQFVSKQLLSADITIMSTIKPGLGLGEDCALDAALAKALCPENDIPALFKYALACSQAIEEYTPLSTNQARHLLSIRAESPENLYAVDYSDGSLTTVPSPNMVPIAIPSTTGHTYSRALRERHDFGRSILQAFGTHSLSSLPEYETRVSAWISKVHHLQNFPPLENCLNWSSYYYKEIRRAESFIHDLRSRGVHGPIEALQKSSEEFTTLFGLDPSPHQSLCFEHGAIAVHEHIAYFKNTQDAQAAISALIEQGYPAYPLADSLFL